MPVSLVGRYEIGDHFEFRSLQSEQDKKRPGWPYVGNIYFSVFIHILEGVYVDFIQGFVIKCIDQPMNSRQELPCFEKNERTIAFGTNPKYYCFATHLTGIAMSLNQAFEY